MSGRKGSVDVMSKNRTYIVLGLARQRTTNNELYEGYINDGYDMEALNYLINTYYLHHPDTLGDEIMRLLRTHCLPEDHKLALK
jgi:hypothetical protein